MAKSEKLLRTSFGTYSVGEKLGEGGSGVVYRCVDENGTPHAVKILDPKKAVTSKLRRFQNEVLFGLRTDHSNIIKVEDHGISEDKPFYVMPLARTTLRKLMASGLSAQDALRRFGEILSGIEAAHLLGVIHRDLKPENVLITASGVAVVADWGAALFQQEDLYEAAETGKWERIANFQYSAPEQRRRDTAVGIPADIFASGLILNEMFTGQVVQGSGAKRIGEVARDFAYIDPLVEEMLQQDPSKRPTSVDAVKLRLQAHQALFDSRQKLDALNRREVVPITTSDDPLVRDPMRIIGRDYDPLSSQLQFKLNHNVGSAWQQAFLRVSGPYTLNGMDPGAVKFSGSVATLVVDPDRAGDAFRFFTQWLEQAIRIYAEMDREKIQGAQREAAARLRQEQERANARVRALGQLSEI